MVAVISLAGIVILHLSLWPCPPFIQLIIGRYKLFCWKMILAQTALVRCDGNIYQEFYTWFQWKTVPTLNPFVAVISKRCMWASKTQLSQNVFIPSLCLLFGEFLVAVAMYFGPWHLIANPLCLIILGIFYSLKLLFYHVFVASILKYYKTSCIAKMALIPFAACLSKKLNIWLYLLIVNLPPVHRAY